MRLRGRQAREASTARNLAKTAIQTVIFWSVFLVLLPLLILRIEDVLDLRAWRFERSYTGDAQTACAVALFALCGSLGLASGATMAVRGRGTPVPLDCPRELVIRGPYRYVRNPMVVAGIGQGIAVGIFLGSWFVIGYALAGAVLWNWLVRPWEEADLLTRFGAPYEAYRRKVRCWIPWRPRGE
jgi:protein-S-isoprenylcysteine O-methyltransferase Ste14